jgi:hypothetical protein
MHSERNVRIWSNARAVAFEHQEEKHPPAGRAKIDRFFRSCRLASAEQ